MKRPVILIADDDEQSQLQMAGSMTTAQYGVICARDVASALLALREEQPDLLLINATRLDNADEMIRFLRHTPGGSAMGVIVIGAASNSADRSAWLEAGADDCLSEPTSKAEILAHVRALLRRLERPERHQRPSTSPPPDVSGIDCSGAGSARDQRRAACSSLYSSE